MTIRQFADSELAPRALQLDETREFPLDISKRTVEMGLVRIMTSEEYRGTRCIELKD